MFDWIRSNQILSLHVEMFEKNELHENIYTGYWKEKTTEILLFILIDTWTTTVKQIRKFTHYIYLFIFLEVRMKIDVIKRNSEKFTTFSDINISRKIPFVLLVVKTFSRYLETCCFSDTWIKHKVHGSIQLISFATFFKTFYYILCQKLTQFRVKYILCELFHSLVSLFKCSQYELGIITICWCYLTLELSYFIE